MKLGPRTGHFVLIAATLLFALPMILVGVAEGGRAGVSDPEPAVVVEPENDPDLGVPAQPSPPPQGEVQGQQPAEPIQGSGAAVEEAGGPPAATR